MASSSSDGHHHDQREEAFRAPRVTQLDAVELDEAAFELTRSQLERAAKFWQWWPKVQPEVQAALQLALCQLTLVQKGASLGQNLLGLAVQQPLGDEGGGKQLPLLLLALSMVGPRWIQERFPSFPPASLSPLRPLLSLGSLANLLLFLRQGVYPTLPHRLLRLRPFASQPRLARSVGYDYLVRELVWHGFLDLLAFLLPLVNFHRMRNLVRRILGSSASPTSAPEQSASGPAPGPLQCSICSQSPILPVLPSKCRHISCYYCAKANLLADTSFACPLCGSSPNETPVQLR